MTNVPHRGHHYEEGRSHVSIWLLIVIILVVLVVFGGFRFRRR